MFQKATWLPAVLTTLARTGRAVHTSWFTASSSTLLHCCWSSTHTSSLYKWAQWGQHMHYFLFLTKFKLFFSILFRPSLLTRKTCANKPRKWMLHHCVRLKLNKPVLNAVWLKLHWWPSHCGSWHGLHTWSSTSPACSNGHQSRLWPPSGDHSLPKLTRYIIQSSMESAIQNTVKLCSRHFRASLAQMAKIWQTTNLLFQVPPPFQTKKHKFAIQSNKYIYVFK